MADFFFYEPLEFPLREVEQMRTLRLVHVNERGEYEREVAVTCRHEDTMQTVVS